MESQRHVLQPELLEKTLLWHWRDRDGYFVGRNMFLYFSETQTRRNDFRGPDFFVVLDTVRRERKSWVVWGEEGRTPDVVVEVLSESTEKQDRGDKMRVYERVLKTPEYYLYDPFAGRLEGFELSPSRYQPMKPDEDGRLTSTVLGLKLGVWQGSYGSVVAPWLRFFTAEGALLPTEAEAEARRADEAEATARAERERADALAQRLSELEAHVDRKPS